MLVAPLIEKNPHIETSQFLMDSGMNILSRPTTLENVGRLFREWAQLKSVCEIFSAFPVGDAAFEYGRVAKAFLPLLDAKRHIQTWQTPSYVEGGEAAYYKLENVVIYPHSGEVSNANLMLYNTDDELSRELRKIVSYDLLNVGNFEKFQNTDRYAEDQGWQSTLNVLAKVKQRTGIDLQPRVTDLHIVTPINGKATVEMFLAIEGAFTRPPKTSGKIHDAFNRDNITYPTRFSESFFRPAPTVKWIGPHPSEVMGWVSMGGGFFISKTERFALRLLRAIGKDPALIVNNTAQTNQETPNAPGNPRGEVTSQASVLAA